MAIDLLQHYPERLFRVVFLDAPFIFGALWSAIRSVLDERTAGKVAARSASETGEGVGEMERRGGGKGGKLEARMQRGTEDGWGEREREEREAG
jgi:hypothetical protein